MRGDRVVLDQDAAKHDGRRSRDDNHNDKNDNDDTDENNTAPIFLESFI